MPTLAEKIDQIAAEFSDLEPRERLELLLEYAEGLPPLDAAHEAQRLAGAHRIHECQSPVFLWVEIEEGKLHVVAYAASEAPTVKGFAAILAEALQGVPVEEALTTQIDLVSRLGLVEALGMQRMRGLQAILHYIRKQISRAAESSP